jgi:uncharacterized membrane protein YeaQ/YmgE (transglycosylase-associated protein family)
MLSLFIWIIYGLVVGFIAKMIHRGPDPVGIIPTILIGILGSYIGGFLNYIFGMGDAISPSGVIMGIIGGIIFCWVYRITKLNQYLKIETQMQNIEIQRLKNEEENREQ